MKSMGLAELFAVVVVGGLVSNAMSHTIAHYWRRAGRQRREAALRHLDEVAMQVHGFKRPPASTAPKWESAAYRRYYIPAGLHLEQARRVMREARQQAAEENSVRAR